MTQNDYYSWLISKISSDDHNYGELLHILWQTPFFASNPMDDSRYIDGVELRYRYSSETSIHRDLVDSPPTCTVLEMLVALSIRCEEHIMGDPDIGDIPARWFWLMIDNLGLSKYYDGLVDRREIDHILNIFMNRQYSPDGHGGLFVVPNAEQDLTKIPIWYQLNWYLSTIEGNELC